MTEDKELMEIARKRVKYKAGFYIHFACYIVVNIGLFAFWWTRTSDLAGFFAIMSGPLFGWGVGIVAHFIGVFYGATEENVKNEYEKLKKIKK